MSKRRKFSTEFKRGAVEQASQPGVSCAQVARELGIRDALLTRWKRRPRAGARWPSVAPGRPGRGTGAAQARAGPGEEGAGFLREAATFFAKGSS